MPDVCLYFQVHQPNRLIPYDFFRIGEHAFYDLDAPPAKRTERSLPDARGPGPVEPATVYRPPSQAPIDGGPSSNPYGGSGSDPR